MFAQRRAGRTRMRPVVMASAATSVALTAPVYGRVARPGLTPAGEGFQCSRLSSARYRRDESWGTQPRTPPSQQSPSMP